MQPRELWLFSLQKMRNLVCSLDCAVVSKARPRNPYSAVTSGRMRMTSERRHITRGTASQCAHKRTPSALSRESVSEAHRQLKYQARGLVLPSYSLAPSRVPHASAHLWESQRALHWQGPALTKRPLRYFRVNNGKTCGV